MSEWIWDALAQVAHQIPGLSGYPAWRTREEAEEYGRRCEEIEKEIRERKAKAWPQPGDEAWWWSGEDAGSFVWGHEEQNYRQGKSLSGEYYRTREDCIYWTLFKKAARQLEESDHERGIVRISASEHGARLHAWDYPALPPGNSFANVAAAEKFLVECSDLVRWYLSGSPRDGVKEEWLYG